MIGDQTHLMMIIMEEAVLTIIKVAGAMERSLSLMLDINHLEEIVQVMDGNRIIIITIMIEVVDFLTKAIVVRAALQIVEKIQMLDGKVINKIVIMIMKAKVKIMNNTRM